jgi:acyl carrier protein
VDTLTAIRSIIANNLGTAVERIQGETRASDLKEWDELRQFHIVSAVEEAFGCSFSAQQFNELDSVEKILSAVDNRSVPASASNEPLTPDTVIEVLKTVRPECEFAGVEDFFSKGVLDSLDLTLLVSALESRLGIAINALDILPGNFRNLSAIIALAAKYGVAA